MNQGKRKRARGIVFLDGKLVSMYREFQDRVFYTIPGGGMEEGETLQECVKREVFEEFGLVVEPVKNVYIYESETSIEYFYLCDYVSGEFGSGQGEEFQPNRNRGVYIPSLIEFEEISKLPLMPPEIAKALDEDLKKNGTKLRDDVKRVN